MTAILRNESRKRIRGSVTLVGAFAFLSAFLFAVFPSFSEEAELIEESLPDVLIGLFGFEAMHTVEGFVAGYAYPMMLVLFAGIYVAYTSAGMIAGDISDRKMDLILSTPVPRASVIAQKFGALWVPLTAINGGLFVIVLAGAFAVGESIDPVVLGMAHLLALPYLLVCAGLGLVFSVVLARQETAEIAALSLVFLLWLVEGIAEMSPDFEWIRYAMPTRYYDMGAILIHEEYALADAGVLLIVFIGLFVTATVLFIRRDI